MARYTVENRGRRWPLNRALHTNTPKGKRTDERRQNSAIETEITYLT